MLDRARGELLRLPQNFLRSFCARWRVGFRPSRQGPRFLGHADASIIIAALKEAVKALPNESEARGRRA
jgi:hypothetical protein